MTQLVCGSTIIDGPHGSSQTESKRIKDILIFYKLSIIFIRLGIENILTIQKLFSQSIKSFKIIGTVYFVSSKLQDCKTFLDIWAFKHLSTYVSIFLIITFLFGPKQLLKVRLNIPYMLIERHDLHFAPISNAFLLLFFHMYFCSFLSYNCQI